jgi:hypothetical protein
LERGGQARRASAAGKRGGQARRASAAGKRGGQARRASAAGKRGVGSKTGITISFGKASENKKPNNRISAKISYHA